MSTQLFKEDGGWHAAIYSQFINLQIVNHTSPSSSQGTKQGKRREAMIAAPLPAAGCHSLQEVCPDAPPQSSLGDPALSPLSALSIPSWHLCPAVGLSAYPSLGSVVIFGSRAVLTSSHPEPKVLFTPHTPQMCFEHTDGY